MTTETQPTSTRPHQAASDHELLAVYTAVQDTLRDMRDQAGRIEMELLTRMRERGATSIPDSAFMCELVEDVKYDQSAFTPLKEAFIPSDLETVFTPAHEETKVVPESWNTVKVKAMARKYGAVALEVVEKARMVAGHRVAVKAKGK